MATAKSGIRASRKQQHLGPLPREGSPGNTPFLHGWFPFLALPPTVHLPWADTQKAVCQAGAPCLPAQVLRNSCIVLRLVLTAHADEAPFV